MRNPAPPGAVRRKLTVSRRGHPAERARRIVRVADGSQQPRVASTPEGFGFWLALIRSQMYFGIGLPPKQNGEPPVNAEPVDPAVTSATSATATILMAIFRDALTSRLRVLHRRKDGLLGLLEPEV